ncbi:TetR/AcrR family transcriptional regulator [Hymenobacter sp. BT175]|uniref:TetR/AcrR family transcriptional regulator n=1 Tax=Hymenobacter translucens TaxID=2886507 RepID=UPI001D0DE886|nr:TetR/AcrR family transcriptional regulator [Hymenobacter translucens]MCC2546068.1 TetR/AcrR family transcriptional regulator [Hymenobacter translucens]
MEIKDRILLEAAALFMRNGIKSVSMDDIAAHLAMSKKTLYKWYENKDQIVLGVMGLHLNREEIDCEQAFSTAGNAVEGMFNLIHWHKDMLAKIHPSIFHDLQKYYPQAWQLFDEHKNTFILQKILDNLRQGMAEGFYRPDIDVDVLARLHLAEIELMFNNTVFPPRQFALQRVNAVMIEHFLMGISTLRGHRLINKYRNVTEVEE